MVEREHILQHIKSTLKDRLGVAVVVTRNMNRTVSPRDLPSVHILDQGERVVSQDPGFITKKKMAIMIQSSFRGSTEEKAPSEFAEFQRQVLGALHGDNLSRVVGTTYKGQILEIQSSAMTFADEGCPNVVTQSIHFEVLYLQDRRRLLD